KAMLVSDVGWFSELPDDVALKIPVDEYEVPTIAAALELAAEHRERLGAAGRAYVRREDGLNRSGAGSPSPPGEGAGGPLVADAVLHRLAAAAAEVGLEDVSELAARVKEAGLA